MGNRRHYSPLGYVILDRFDFSGSYRNAYSEGGWLLSSKVPPSSGGNWDPSPLRAIFLGYPLPLYEGAGGIRGSALSPSHVDQFKVFLV